MCVMQELVLRMQLPGVSGAGAVDLDVTRTQVWGWGIVVSLHEASLCSSVGM